MAEVPNLQKPEDKIDLVELVNAPEWKSLLLDLVKSQKMDPWNIDIVALADAYLKKISASGHADLRFPANAILASAILLRLKARVLVLSSIEEEQEPKALTEEEKLMQRFIPELRSPRQMREGKISLDELVDAIEAMLAKTKTKKSIIDKDIKPVEFAINYNEESMQGRIDEVYQLIQKNADSQGLVIFSKLVENKPIIDVIKTFIPCLFLTNKGKINMWQEAFFGEIFISLKAN